MSHKKEVSFDFPLSVPSTGGNYVRDKSGELNLIEAEKPLRQAQGERPKRQAKASAPEAPATEEGN